LNNLDREINSQTYDSLVINVVENTRALGDIAILSPENNQRFNSGDLVEFSYQTSSEGDNSFKYAELILQNFNEELVFNIKLAEAEGQVVFRAPVLDEQENMKLVMRAYFGDQYDFTEKEVNLRVFPSTRLPIPELSGVSS